MIDEAADIPAGFWQFSFDTVLPSLLAGLQMTLLLLVASAICGMLLGLALALCRLSPYRWLRWPASIYIGMFRGTPLLLQILFIYFALPPLLDIRLDAMPAGILALSLNAGAYLAEIFRAGVESIGKGQMEAARALGMSYALAMRLVILPQSIKRLIPPVVNELAALAKDTSLVSVIALSETLYVAQRLGAKYFRPWEVYVWAAAFYLIIVLILSGLARRLERRLQSRE
ncbi:MAG: amino acid ABC transporter permease [Proteobacteria bacterium]|nr:amino acid ABC transporter permease [Pseudomonadota bacterium]